MRVWHLPEAGRKTPAPEGAARDEVLYTNAKVLLVGDSGVGKTGLSNFLAHGIRVEDDKPLPSTDGAWATPRCYTCFQTSAWRRQGLVEEGDRD